MIPVPVRERLESRWGSVAGATPVTGGCINAAARVELPSGSAFLKWNPDAPAGLFATEARGLEELRQAASELRIPEVLDVWEHGLLLEWLEPVAPQADHDARLGRWLALLHRAPPAGGAQDNWIGPLVQSNSPAASWAEFWIMRRLEPQLQRARDAGRMPGQAREWDGLFARIPELLAPAMADGASLLHGDLWSGNVLATTRGPALVDPAVYHGHREVDLAMAELFGGLSATALAAYTETWPLLPGHTERQPVYQLYPLLIHVNLFGSGYVAQAARVLRSA